MKNPNNRSHHPSNWSSSLFAALLLFGCGSGDSGFASAQGATGTERGPCRSGRTCDPGLVCLSDVCVRMPDGGISASGGASGSTGGSADGGSGTGVGGASEKGGSNDGGSVGNGGAARDGGATRSGVAT